MFDKYIDSGYAFDFPGSFTSEFFAPVFFIKFHQSIFVGSQHARNSLFIICTLLYTIIPFYFPAKALLFALVVGKITLISSILDNNPSFSFYPERLLLMLNLPLESLPEFVRETSFPQLAEKMLTRWAAEKQAAASTDRLASLLAINGHFYTCGKLSTKIATFLQFSWWRVESVLLFHWKDLSAQNQYCCHNNSYKL